MKKGLLVVAAIALLTVGAKSYGNSKKKKFVPYMYPILSPDMVLRNDKWGQGFYKAPRGDRKHRGIDWEARRNQKVVSPISGKVTRTFQVYKDDTRYVGIEIIGNGKYVNKKIKLMYVAPVLGLFGKTIKAGQFVGTVQAIAVKYGETPKKGAMHNHVHMETWILVLHEGEMKWKNVNPMDMYKGKYADTDELEERIL